MSGTSTRDAARLLMLLTEFGHVVTRGMTSITPAPELVDNAPLFVLSCIEVEGPQRPRELAAAMGMTTGGLSKLLDRMEELGVVIRQRGLVDGDRRAVIVSNTELGSETLQRVTKQIEDRLPETRHLVQEITALLETE